MGWLRDTYIVFPRAWSDVSHNFPTALSWFVESNLALGPHLQRVIVVGLMLVATKMVSFLFPPTFYFYFLLEKLKTRAKLYTHIKILNRVGASIFLWTFQYPSLAINVNRLELSDFDSAWTCPTLKCSNTLPSVLPWLMFKEWSKNPWPTHLTARGS